MGYRDSNQAVPDRGTQHSAKADRMVLRCADCAWSVSSTSAAVAVREATSHALALDHRLTYRGVTQAWPAGGLR